MNSALLVKSVETLIPCEGLAELASRVADLAQEWLETPDVFVLLRSGGMEYSAGTPGSGLRNFAEQLLTVEAASGVTGADGRLAAVLHATSPDVRGVIVVMPGHPEDTEAAALLGALGELTAKCSAQIQSHALTNGALHDTRVLMTRGLHDLCTSLNVLRLGMHLLEPVLNGKDPTVAQRTSRAIDKMAVLIGSMAEAVGNEQLKPPLEKTAAPASAKAASA